MCRSNEQKKKPAGGTVKETPKKTEKQRAKDNQEKWEPEDAQCTTKGERGRGVKKKTRQEKKTSRKSEEGPGTRGTKKCRPYETPRRQ